MLTEWWSSRINHGKSLRDKSSQVAVKLGAYDSREGAEGVEAVRRVVPSIAGGCRRLARRRPVPRIFIGCKGRHLRSIKTLVSEALARAGSQAKPCAAHTPTRPLPLLPGRLSRATTGTRLPPGQLHTESRASERETLEIYRLRSSVTPRKLGLTTVTGPNCFLPAIKILTCSPGSFETLWFLSIVPTFGLQKIIVYAYDGHVRKCNGFWPYGFNTFRYRRPAERVNELWGAILLYREAISRVPFRCLRQRLFF